MTGDAILEQPVGAAGAAAGAAVLTANVAELVAGSLEQFAFVLACPAELPADPPATPGKLADAGGLLFCSLPFAGAAAGRLELVFPRAVAAAVSANLLCGDPSEPATDAVCADAARELMNVTGGALLARLGEAELSRTTMGLPTVRPATDADWWAIAADPHAAGLDAEGHLVVARVVVD